MTKLSDAVALLNAAPHEVQWDTSGECIVVRTTYFEKDGTTVAGTIKRNFNDDQPAPAADEHESEQDAGDVVVDLTGNEATAKGVAL